MHRRRSMRVPITLAVVMIVILLLLIIGWVALTIIGAYRTDVAPFYWTLLPLGTSLIIILLLGVVAYLVIAIRTISLNRRQQNFIDSVTHELKSPIASLRLHLQTLRRRTVSPEKQAEFNELMIEDVDRLDRLITQILDASRIDAGQAVGDIDEVRIDWLVKDCVSEVLRTTHVGDDVFKVDIDPSYCVYARAAHLRIVVRNLLENAIKYGGDPPRVEITAQSKEKGGVTVCICDNGRGIEPNDRKRIFRRFVRLGEELHRKTRGTGLGLYIVRTLIRRIGGDVRVIDRPGGQGSMFELEIPEQEKP